MGITDIVTAATKAYEIAQSLANVELQQTILELKTAAITAQEDALRFRDERQQLQAELEAIRRREQIQTELEFKDNAYWRTIDDKREGPYCSACWDVKGQLVRLLTQREYTNWFRCPGCDTQEIAVRCATRKPWE